MILACYIATLCSKYGLFDNEAIPAIVPKLVVTGAFQIFSNAGLRLTYTRLYTM